MTLPIRNLDWLRKVNLPTVPGFGQRLYESLNDVQSGVEVIEQQTNSNASGTPAPPPALDSFSVVPHEHGFDVAIQHEGDFYRGLEYYIDYADNPHFQGARTYPMGESRNAVLPLGPQKLYFQARAKYASSDSTAPLILGGALPRPVIGGLPPQNASQAFPLMSVVGGGGGGGSGITQLTGDVTAGPGSGSQPATVVKIQGVGVSATAPTSGQVLKYDGTVWTPENESGGMTNPMTTVGDLIVGGVVTGGVAAPARLAAGTAGQVLTSNGPGVAPSYQPEGGGGGSGMFANTITIPTLASLDFNTAWNQRGTFAAVDTPIGPFLSDINVGTSNYWEGIVGGYPSAPFTITALFSIPINSGNYDVNGIVILNTLTGAFIQVGFQGGVNEAIVDGVPNPTSSTPTNLLAIKIGIQPAYIWIKYQDDGTNMTCLFSSDGNFWPISYTVAKSASYLGASGFNYLGLGIAPIARPTGVTLMSWKLTNP